MSKRTFLLIVIALAVIFAGSIFVAEMVKSGEETSDQIPDSVTGSQKVEFSIAVGNPGSTVVVTTDKGELIISPDAVIDSKIIGQVKSQPDEALETAKSRKYIVDDEGRVAFSLRGDPAHAGQEAIVRVLRDGVLISGPHKVMMLAAVSDADVSTEIASGQIVYVDKDEYVQDGEAGVNVTLSLRNQAGEEIDLSQGEYFANVTLLTENGTRLLEIGPTDNGMETSYHISRPLFIVPVLEPNYPFTISVSIEGDQENILLTKTFTIEQ